MDEDDFWDAIGLLDWDCEGGDAAVAEPLVAHLAALPDGDLFVFDDALAAHLRARPARRGRSGLRPFSRSLLP